MKYIFACLIIAAASGPSSALAAIVAGGDFKSGATPPTLMVTAPITFTITSSGHLVAVVFDEWVTSDGDFSSVNTGGGLFYRLDAGPTLELTLSSLVDNLAEDFGSITVNDGYLRFDQGLQVVSGQTFTIFPQTWSFTSTGDFNQPPAIFTGSAFLVGTDAVAISNTVAVPEFTSAALSALAGLFLLGRRR